MCLDVGVGFRRVRIFWNLMNLLLNYWENVLEFLIIIIRIRFFGFIYVCRDKYCSNLFKRKMIIRKFLLKGS